MKEEICLALKKIHKQHVEDLTGGASTLLTTLANITDIEITRISDIEHQAIFDKNAVDNNSGSPSVSSQKKRIEQLNQFFNESQISLTLKHHESHYHLEFDHHFLAEQPSQAIIKQQLDRSKAMATEQFQPPMATSTYSVFLSHKWDKSKAYQAVFEEFASLLQDKLSSPPENQPNVELFYDKDFKHGEKRETQQD